MSNAEETSALNIDPESNADEQSTPSRPPSTDASHSLHSQFEFVFGAALALVPLGLWTAISIWMMVLVLTPGDCIIGIEGEDDNDAINECKINSYALSVYNVSFGLVTAFVIAELAVTPSGKDPSDRLIEGAEEAFDKPSCCSCLGRIVPWLPAFYMIVWVIVGLSSLIIGGFVVGGAAGTLKHTGMTWFGTIITAVYTYFGLNPPNEPDNSNGPLSAGTQPSTAAVAPTNPSPPANSSPIRAITIGAGGGSGRLSAL